MANFTKIEWADATFNPWIGCTRISPACDHCYASVSTPARVLGVTWGAGERRLRTSPSNWKLPLRWEGDHEAFFTRHGRRRRVFCASLADVFDNEVPTSWRADLFGLIQATPNLDWLLLTKRIGNALPMMDEAGGWAGAGPRDARSPLPNVWLGATIANQAEADRDIPKLLVMPARVRFLSIEPLLGPVDLSFYIYSEPTGRFRMHQGKRQLELRRPADGGLHWVIAGGESGQGARPMHPDWLRSLRDQCAAAGVPFFFKQWGEWAPREIWANPHPMVAIKPDGAPVPDDVVPQEVGGQRFARVGKRAAGRVLDGIEHNGTPA